MNLDPQATLLAISVITLGGTIVTNRQARKTAQSTAQTTVSGQVEAAKIAAEERAFERAREGYEAAIHRRDIEIGELEQDVQRLRSRVADLEGRLSRYEFLSEDPGFSDNDPTGKESPGS